MSDTFNAGVMFARSEIDAAESFEVFARAVGTTPTYEVWQAERINFVNGYVSIKPHAKGDSADKAFQRFKDRVVQAFEIVVPTSDNAAAIKKAAERKAANEKLLAEYQDVPPTLLRAQLEAAYQALAKDPTSKVAKAQAKKVEKALKLKTSESDKAERSEVKALKDSIREALKACDDTEKLEAALDALK
jgi:hypothetical protein